MPIDESQWDQGEIVPAAEDPAPTPVGSFDTEQDLVLAFLSENHDAAFTRAEVVKGVDFGETADPTNMLDRLLKLPNQFVDVAGDLTASELVDDDVSEALNGLVADGVVTRKRIERSDGEPEIYYRLAEE